MLQKFHTCFDVWSLSTLNTSTSPDLIALSTLAHHLTSFDLDIDLILDKDLDMWAIESILRRLPQAASLFIECSILLHFFLNFCHRISAFCHIWHCLFSLNMLGQCTRKYRSHISLIKNYYRIYSINSTVIYGVVSG